MLRIGEHIVHNIVYKIYIHLLLSVLEKSKGVFVIENYVIYKVIEFFFWCNVELAKTVNFFVENLI